MASIVGVIYAVLLAFIAVAAWENFNRAGDVTMKEATKLGDLYRDSRLLSPAVSTDIDRRSEEHTSELQSLMRISYAVFCLTKKNDELTNTHTTDHKQIHNIRDKKFLKKK